MGSVLAFFPSRDRHWLAYSDRLRFRTTTLGANPVVIHRGFCHLRLHILFMLWRFLCFGFFHFDRLELEH